MIKSMTGYGKGESQFGPKKITVEIRSLNSKQADLSIKLPQIYRPYEYDIRNRITGRLKRGKIDVFISYEITEGGSTVSINREAFTSYYRQLQDIAAANHMEWGGSAMDAAVMAAIVRLPDVIQNEASSIDEQEAAVLLQTVETALDHLDAFRQQEGAALIADLLRRIDKIESLKNEVTPYEKARTETIKNRIRESIESMGIPVDSNRLEQEMIFYVEKLDITEEKVRLQNHCNYFREVAHSEEGVGRKLGFIAQELGREINTLGSKANNAEMQILVVEMKDELEKIKEQLLNIL